VSAAPSPSHGAGAARALLGEARQAGLVLELDADGRVRFEATRGPPPPELLARLRAHKAELAALLAAERDRAPDPTAPLLALLEAGEPKAAADMLAEAARVWLDPWTWQELADLARTGPDRCRPALAAVLARDMAALDALLGERAPVAPAEPPRPEPPYPSGAAAPELPELDPLAARRLARAAELFAGGYVRTLRSHWRAWAPDRTAELERAIAELRGCTDRERAERVFAAALLGDPA
jgi:hypothetical protein